MTGGFGTQSNVIEAFNLPQFSEPQQNEPNIYDFEKGRLNKVVTCQSLNENLSDERDKAKRRLEKCAKKLEKHEIMLQRKGENLRRARKILLSVKENKKIS